MKVDNVVQQFSMPHRMPRYLRATVRVRLGAGKPTAAKRWKFAGGRRARAIDLRSLTRSDAPAT